MSSESIPPSENGITDGDRQTAALAGRLLVERGRRLVVAESCTGGLLGHLLTEVPGSSAWFIGGVIAYDDSVKAGLLAVPLAVLREHGAVSEECAGEMARGALRLLGGDLALTITGIAGPAGGTPGKPVGTVYIAVAEEFDTRVISTVWHGSRSENKLESARAALALLLEHLERG